MQCNCIAKSLTGYYYFEQLSEVHMVKKLKQPKEVSNAEFTPENMGFKQNVI